MVLEPVALGTWFAVTGEGYDAPIEDKSIAGTITFFAYHESYDIGQMAYVRKWLGRGGIIDG